MSVEGLKKVKPFLLSVFFYLSFSKLSLWFLLFPFFFLLSRQRSFKVWLSVGFLSTFLSLLWIRIAMIKYGEVYPPLAYILIALLALFMALLQFGISYWLWRLAGYNLLALPPAWVFAEVIRSNFPYGGFPWLIVGELLVHVPLLFKHLSAGGVYLGSFVVWFLALTPYALKSRGVALGLFISILLPIPFWKEQANIPDGVKIAIVQPNVREDIKLDREAFYGILPSYFKLLENAIEYRPDIVFLPESAFPFYGHELASEGKRLLELSHRAILVTGIVDIRFGEEIEPYNSVFVIHKGKVVDFYDKVRLLPFGEYIPFPFSFVKEIFGAIAGTDYLPGEELRCLEAGKLKIATPICFEVSYFHLVRKLADCADLIAVLTNDGWFEDSDGTYQHFRQARARAVETGKYLLWVNNTGPSAVISPEGKVLKEIPYGTEGIIFFEF